MTDTAIIILNWNNGTDTILSIQSVLGLKDVTLIVVDNNSTDNSLDIITGFLIKESVNYTLLSDEEFEIYPDFDVPVIIVKNPVNGGFAQGNNLILRRLLKVGNYRYAWLLNNDAVAVHNTLPKLKHTIEQQDNIAFAGSVILDFDKRDLIQCCGVHYYKWLGVGKLILKNCEWHKITRDKIPFKAIDFQHGASLLVKLSALKEIGLMDERFFLYSEEHDWQATAQEAGYGNALAYESIVYHKGSAGTKNKKHLFYYNYNKSSIIFTRKHNNPITAVVASCLLAGITLVRTKQYYKNFFWGVKGILDGWTVNL